MRRTICLFGLVVVCASSHSTAGATPPLVVLTEPADQTSLLVPSGAFTCGGTEVQPLGRVDLPPLGADARSSVSRPSTALHFTINADGRPASIAPSADARPRPTGGGPEVELQAVLAGMQFAPAPQQDCRLDVTYELKAVADASQEDLLRYFAVTRTTGPLRNAVARQLGGADFNCGRLRGGRRPRTVSYPDFRAGDRPEPGEREWTVVRWNIESDGRASGVETIGSSGDVALDAEARRAVSDTVVHEGSLVRGCVYNFHRTGQPLSAPVPPAPDKDVLSDCPEAVRERLQISRLPTYPAAFRQRGIEGWALVRFDLAPWGATGNVAIIDAQPAAAFGESAAAAVRTARATPGFEAGVRCVLPIRFEMQDQPAVDASEDAGVAPVVQVTDMESGHAGH